MPDTTDPTQRRRGGRITSLATALAVAGAVVGWLVWRGTSPGVGETATGPLPRPGLPGVHGAPVGRLQGQFGPARPARLWPARPDPSPPEASGQRLRAAGEPGSVRDAAADIGPQVNVRWTAPGVLEMAVAGVVPEYVPLGDGSYRVKAAGTLPLAAKGQPALPFLRRDVLLAGDSEPVVEVDASAWDLVRCPRLGLSPGFVSRSERGSGAPLGDEHTAPGAPFPASAAWLTPVYRFRGRRGVGVILCPFRYDRAGGTLAVCRRLTIRVRGAADGADLALLPSASLPAAARRWPDQVGPLAKGSPPPWAGGALLVLVPESLAGAPALASFLSWKHQRGVAVTLRTLPPQPGVTTIRSAIRAFAEAVTDASVLLLGDETAIPPAQAAAPPSDTLYAMLDGTGDRYHDLAIGRLAVTSAADLALQLGRAEQYERWQWSSDSAGAWCPTVTCIASNENQGNLGLRDWEAMDQARETLARDGGYTLCEPLYDSGTRSPTKADLALGWNHGRGLILYLGHGLQQSWRTTGFSGPDVNQLLHYGPSLPFVLSAACHTGNFTLGSDCLCESLLKGGTAAAPTGAVAAVGATSAMDWDPPVVMLQSFAAYLAQPPSFAAGGMVFAGGPARSTAGELTFAAVQRAVDFCLATPTEGDAAARKIAEQTHLFGDPTLGIRTRVPVRLSVEHAARAGREALFPVQVNASASGDPVSGVVVCLSGPESQWQASTDDSGLATVPVPAGEAEVALTLTAYAPNVIPYQAPVTLLPARAPLTVLTTGLPPGRRGEPYAAVLTAEGGTGQGYRWTATSALPDGLTVTEAGSLTGTPRSFGAWTVTVRVEDGGEPTTATEAVLELVIESPVFIPMEGLPEATACARYETDITAAGSWPPFVFSVPGADRVRPGEGLPFPAWLLLSPAGRLSGLAGGAGTTAVTVVVTDAAGNVCTAVFPLAIRAPSPDTDGLDGVQTAELLAFRSQVQSGCATADDWLAALAWWQGAGLQTTPDRPGPTLVGTLAARRVMVSPRYLPGARETLRIELLGATGLAPGTVAVLTEVLPAGWTLADAALTAAAGRRLPGPRRDGQAVSWVLDEESLAQGGLTYTVSPARPTAEPVVFEGWLTLSEGTVPTAGSRLWWARRAREFRVPLQGGWNLVSWPLEVPADALSTAFGELELRGCALGAPAPARPAAAEPLVAYWVWAPTPGSVILSGYEADRSEPAVPAGWTACGVARRTAVAEFPGNPITAWAWGQGGWEPVAGDLLPGHGYLVFRP